MTPDRLPARRGELARLWTALHDRPALTLLSGPIGSGTTTVARALVARVRTEGGVALQVAPRGADLDPPGALWTRLATVLDRTLSTGTSDARSTPGPAPGPPHGVTDVAEPSLTSVLATLDRVGPGPNLVVLEDLHLADEVSLALLSELVSMTDLLPVALVGVLVDPDSHPIEAGRLTLQWLRTTCTEVHLGPLSPPEVVEVVATRAGEDARAWATRHAAALTERTAGNPLLLTALIEDLGLPAGSRPELTVTPHLPVVERLVTARLAQLGSGVERLLLLVAAAAPDADTALLLAVLAPERSAEATDAAATDAAATVAADLRVAMGSGLLRRRLSPAPDGTDTTRLDLVHPLVATVLHRRIADLGPEAHARIAAHLRATDCDDDVRILHHLVLAGAHADAAELDRTTRQVLRAPRRWEDAEVEAAALTPQWHRAADHDPGPAPGPGHDPHWRQLGLRLADAWYRAGDRSRSWRVAHEVLTATPAAADADLVAAAAALTRGQVFAASAPEAARALQEAARRLGDDHPRAPALLADAAELVFGLPLETGSPQLGGHPAPASASATSTPATSTPATATSTGVLGWSFQRERAGRALGAAAALAARHGDPQAQAHVDLVWAKIHRQPEHLAERITRCRQVLNISDEPEVRADAAVRLVIDELTAANRRGVATALAELAAVVRATGDLRLRWWEQSLRTMVAQASGHLTQAAEHLALAVADGHRSGEPAVGIEALLQGTLIAFEADEPLPDLAGEHGLLASLHTARLAGVLWWQAATGQALLRDPAELIAELRGADPTTPDPDAGHDLLAATLLAEVVWLTRRAELAAELLPVLSPWQHLVAVDTSGSYTHGTVARLLAALHWLDGDPEAMRTAEATSRQLARQAGLERDLVAGELDAVVRAEEDGRLTDPARREALAAVADRAEALGLARLARTARARIDPGLRARLTDRQAAVLRHLAAGRTYEAIAAELGYSHGTIRKEAIKLYAALEVDNRRDAVVVARQTGLV